MSLMSMDPVLAISGSFAASVEALCSAEMGGMSGPDEGWGPPQKLAGPQNVDLT